LVEHIHNENQNKHTIEHKHTDNPEDIVHDKSYYDKLKLAELHGHSHDDSDDYHDHDHNKLTKMNNDICKCSHNIKNLEGRNSLDKLEQEFFDKNYHGNLISIP